jgi:hypothetical protein
LFFVVQKICKPLAICRGFPNSATEKERNIHILPAFSHVPK